MSKPALSEIMLGGFAYIAEFGKTIDMQTVGPLIKPDDSPLSNWTNIGNVLKFKPGKEEVDDSFNKCLNTGRWVKVNRKKVVQRYVDVTTREMGEWVQRLTLGLTSEIVNGTPQSPGAAEDDFILCWLRFQARQDTGTDLYVYDYWSEMRLVETPEHDGPKVATPQLRFTMYPDGFTLPGGNTLVFPV